MCVCVRGKRGDNPQSTTARNNISDVYANFEVLLNCHLSAHKSHDTVVIVFVPSTWMPERWTGGWLEVIDNRFADFGALMPP